jgi:site-specific recombinase XerD
MAAKTDTPVTDKPRREYKTGSVYQRASDGLWLGTIEAGYTAKGGRRRISVSGKTEAIVKKKLRDKQAQIAREGTPAAGARMTVAKYAGGWLEARRTKIRRGPWATDASAVNRWIIPTIGHRRLDALTPADIRAVAAAQRQAGNSSSSAHRTHWTINAMLKAAMLDGYQVPARVLLVETPALAARDMDAMPGDQLEKVLTLAMAELPHWSRWLVQVLYGQRPAEVLGLTWGALDFERKTLAVEWQLQALPYVDRTNKALGFVVQDGMKVRHLVDAWHLTPPKTKKGLRLVPMLPIVEAALLEWQARTHPSPHGLVWPALNGRPANEKHDREEWHFIQACVDVAHPSGRPWKIYEARHAFATRLLEGGVDERVITELMGHSSIVTSRGYQHVRPERALEALTLINQGLGLTAPRGAVADTPALPGAGSPAAL